MQFFARTPLPPAPGKRTEPTIPVGHPDFVWTSGADVQRTWRRFGWTPIERTAQRDFSSGSCTTSQL